jgi:3-oxoacyl-[acyl-carrier protein] reductase
MTAPELQRDLAGAFGLDGRVAFVTGAGSGIGEETAHVLAAAGAHVVCADLDAARTTEVAASIVKDGGSAAGIALDVTRGDDVRAAVSAVAAEHGRLDVMANVAGIMIEREAMAVSEAEFDKVLAVNLKGVLFGCQAAGAVMGPGSAIVNVTSSIIDAPSAGRVAYAASKSGVVQVTRHFALELGQKGIRVNAVAPGWTVSGLTARHFTEADGTVDPTRLESVLADKGTRSPLGLVGQPIDTAMTVLFLAAPASRFYTGSVLRPAGGSVMA